MKKIVLSEQQIKKLMSEIINEQVPAMRAIEYPIDENEYSINGKFHIYWDDKLLTYKSGQIEEIYDGEGIIRYQIEIDHSTEGIKGIYVSNIKFPHNMKVLIRYYPEGHSEDDEDWYKVRRDENVNIPIDWRKAKKSVYGGSKLPYFGIEPMIDVNLKPDGKGGFIGYVDEFDVKEFHGEED